MRVFIVFLVFILFSFQENLAQNIEQFGKGNPVRISGTINIQGGPYVYIGKGTPRNDPYWWQASGSPTVSIYGWQLPFSFSYGSRNRSFYQPFNRFGVSPYWKWLTFHFGYRSIRMNPYVMSGVQFLGAGVEMNPRGFRFGAFYGRLSKPIARDTLASITPIPAYKRMAYGLKIGAGSRRNYVDLSIVKVFDDSTSIPSIGLKTDLRPQDNVAFGLSGRLALGSHLTFQFDAGGSLLNRDIRLPLMDISNSLKPYSRIFTPHLGAQFLTAGKASLNYNQRYFGLKLLASRVDPDYRSLAAFYQQSDMQSITIEPTLKLMKNKLRLSGSIGQQQDNLYRRKAYTSVRTIGSANVSWNSGKKYSLSINFSNYGMAQQAGLQVINDTFRIAQNNRSISLSQQYSFTNKIRTLSLSMNVSYQQLQDLNHYGTYASGENKVWFMNVVANHIRTKDNLSLQGGINVSNNEFVTGSYLLVGPMLGASKPFAKNKIQLTCNLSYNKGFQKSTSSGSTLNFYSSLMYQLSKTHQFNIALNVLQNSTPFISTGTFSEIRLLAGYILNFQPKK